jgi:hypothetical protein
MRRYPAFLFAAFLCLLPATTHAEPVNAEQIVWRLKNPFRYFKNAAHTEQHVRAFQALSPEQRATPVLSTELKLAADTDGMGWASAMFAQVEDENCWYSNSANKAESGDKTCGTYIRPAAHTILVSAPTVTGRCTWTTAAQTQTADDCSKPREFTIPYPAGAEVALSVGGQVTARRTVVVEDLLVAGLGDSFGSGEGNPDRPVTFKQRRSLDYGGSQYPRDEFAGFPLRDGLPRGADDNHPAFAGKGAGWVHRKCHRSLYSQQLRAALHLAISDPALQRSVTYLGFACTGATILDLFGRYEGREEHPVASDPPHAARAMGLSQLSILAHAMCKPGTLRLDETVDYNAIGDRTELLELGGRAIRLFKCADADRLRPIDILLLSIGGNDVGFSGLVANAALNPAYLGLPRLFNEDPTLSPARAADYLVRLPGRYAALAAAIKTAFGVGDDSRVLLTAYPQLGYRAQGEACPSGNTGMDVTTAWHMSGEVIRQTEAFVAEKFLPAMAAAAGTHGWSLVADHRKGPFEAHGLCAAEAEQNNGAIANPRFPRFHTGGGPGRWRPYGPDAFRPYAATQRYFRTPNDAFMAVHYHGDEATLSRGGRRLQLTSWSGYSGAFHPNALGHAAIADDLVKSVEKVLATRTATAR